MAQRKIKEPICHTHGVHSLQQKTRLEYQNTKSLGTEKSIDLRAYEKYLKTQYDNASLNIL